MPFLITALVGFLVLPFSATAPLPAEASFATTKVGVSAKLALADSKSAVAPFTVQLTAYNALPEQTDATPFVTASGSFSNPEVIAARSNDLKGTLPFGTVIALTQVGTDSNSCKYSKVESQIGYRVIADSMNPRISNTVDVLLDQNKTVWVDGREVNPGIALGRCGQVSIQIVGQMNVKDIPETQAELAAMVSPSHLATR